MSFLLIRFLTEKSLNHCCSWNASQDHSDSDLSVQGCPNRRDDTRQRHQHTKNLCQ